MSQVAASTQWKDIFFTLILFIQVCCHFQLQGWNQEGREVTRNLFWKLFVLTISKFLERCLQGRFILFLLQACNVDNIDKNSFIHNFPRFCYNSKQLFEIIGNDKNTYLPECLRMAASTSFCDTCTTCDLIYFFIDVFQMHETVLSN